MTIRWPSRLVAFLLWILAALSATYWLLKIVGLSEAPVTAEAVDPGAPAIDVRAIARALGPDATPAASATAAQPAPLPQVEDPSGRMRLLGVAAGRSSGGVALISIEGQPPRPYRVGSLIDDRYKLTRVAARSATLSPTQSGGPAFTLELPLTSANADMPRPAAVARPELQPPGPPGVNRAVAGRPSLPEPPPAVGEAEEPAKD